MKIYVGFEHGWKFRLATLDLHKAKDHYKVLRVDEWEDDQKKGEYRRRDCYSEWVFTHDPLHQEMPEDGLRDNDSNIKK